MSQYEIDDEFAKTQDGPGQLYGYKLPVLPSGYTGYYFPPAFSGAAFQVQSPETGPTVDLLRGYSSGGWADAFFGADGDDTMQGETGNDLLVGGSGDDTLQGQDDNDTLYGDYSNTHIIVEQDNFNLWRVPSEADSSVVGNDLLDGGNGADTLYGGPGDDQLYGGPRGDGFTDVISGGDGADAFYLTYTEQSSGGGGTSFWSAFGSGYVSDIANGAVNNGVSALATAAASEFFSSIVGSTLLGGLGTAVGDLAGEGISLLFGMNKSATPQPTGEDVMVITDFDPREDVMFLPVSTSDQANEATTLTQTPTYFSESASGANGQTGWGIEFTKGTSDTVFAEVFLAPDFLEAFGITESSEFAFDFIHDVFDNSLVIDENGVEDTQSVYPFPTNASDYADGVVPVVADAPVPFKAPSGTTTKVFGAFGPLAFVAPTTTTTGVYVSGTNLGDILNVNPASFDPATAVESGSLTSDTSHVMAFDGDDIIFAGNGVDTIDAGDGDDWIYGIGHESIETVEHFAGNDGDDLIYLGWTSMSAVADGGDGTDTVSFVYVDGPVAADLSVATTDPINNPNATSTNNTDNLTSRYALTNVENLGGSEKDDKLTGDDNDNVIQGNAGNDSLDGGGGNDTASYADNTGKVTVSLPDGLAQEFGADGSSEADTVVSADTLTNFENVTGSPFDDTLTGDDNDNILQGNAGNDSLDGGGGTDTASYADNTGKVTVDLTSGTASEFGPDGGSNAKSVVSNDTLLSIEAVIGSPFADSITGSDDEPDYLAGGDGDDTISGLNGDDTLNGDDGDDTLLGGGDNDRLIGGDGNDTLNGGSGVNTADYSGNTGKVTIHLDTGSVLEFGADGTSQAGQVMYRDTLVDVDVVVGSAYSDLSYGGTGDDTMEGGDGNDVLRGDDGDDNLSGDNGNDVLNGGDGSDSLDGGDDDDMVYGGLGADTITGGDGDDFLAGGTDGVLYRVNAGGGTVFATDGSLDWAVDTAQDKSPYVSNDPPIFQTAAPLDYVATKVNDQPIELFYQERWYSSDDGKMVWNFPVSEAGNYEVRLYLVEGVEGANPNADPPTRVFSVQIEGDAFGDFVNINPFVQGGNNNGGLGRMPYVLANSHAVSDGGVTLTFIPVVQNPKINAIEILTSGPTDNSADILDGGDGNDTLVGDGGADTLTGGAGDDNFRLVAGQGTDTVTDFQQGSDLFQLVGTSFADLSFTGSNILLGSEILAIVQGVNTTTLTQNDFVKLDAPVSPEQITDGGGGTLGDDVIFGSDEADTLAGLAGDDTLNGNAGDDMLYGGPGDDIISGGDGDDQILAGAGNDTATGGKGDDRVVGGPGDDTLAGAGGDDTVMGESGDDSLNGGSGDDTVDGGDNNDSLYGGDGNDILVSGAGIVDIAYGGDGADTHVFGAELANGIRETDIIQDYDPLEDLIDLGGSEIVRHVESTDSVVLFAGADQDVIIVNGATGLDSIAFVEGTLNHEVMA